MMTLSNGNVFRVTVPLCREFTGDRWIPLTTTSNAALCVFFDLHLNKRLSKQSWGWWFETPLWRHCNAKIMAPRNALLHCSNKTFEVALIMYYEMCRYDTILSMYAQAFFRNVIVTVSVSVFHFIKFLSWFILNKKYIFKFRHFTIDSTNHWTSFGIDLMCQESVSRVS